MRILHVLDHSIPLHSGYAFRTLSILREQRQIGWDTTHITSPKHAGDNRVEETVDGFHFFRTLDTDNALWHLPIIDQYSTIRLLTTRLREIVTEVNPDIIHAHSPCLNGLAALSVGRQYNIPVVYEMRASWEDAAVSHGTAKEGSIRYKLSRQLETYVLKRASAVTTICQGLKKDIVIRGIPEDKITVIPNAVNVDHFDSYRDHDSDLVTQLGLENKKIIGYIGSFYHYEGLDILVDALPKILEVNPDVMLVLAGGGFQDDALRSQVKRLGLDSKVIFTGRIPHSEVHRYYSIIDILVYPRRSIRLTELVTPLKPLEAMAARRLFVASDIGGHAELIEDGVTGTLFKAEDPSALADAVNKLYGNREIWQSRLTQAFDYVTVSRNWKTVVQGYESVYLPLVQSQTKQ